MLTLLTREALDSALTSSAAPTGGLRGEGYPIRALTKNGGRRTTYRQSEDERLENAVGSAAKVKDS